MSDTVKLAISFFAMVGSAIGIDYMNRAAKSNARNKSVKGYKRIPVSKMSKYFLILLLLISLGVLIMSALGIGKSTGAINAMKAKADNLMKARAAQAMPPSPAVPPAP
jgi:ATP-dependent Zn protease